MAEGTLEITISNQIVLATSVSITGTGGANTINTFAGTLQLIETILPSDTTDKSVTWSIITGASFATIDGSGLVTALEDGSVTVRVMTNDGSGIFSTFTIIITNQTIYVSNIIVSSIGGDTTISDIGQTMQMTASINPPNADDPTYTWSVVNGTGGATIDANGLLTSVSAGTVNVIATANDLKGNAGQLSITIYEVVTPPNTKSIAPIGWHVPTTVEFDDLVSTIGANAGRHLKEAGINNWNAVNDADNNSEFTALGAGARSATEGTFNNVMVLAYFHSSDNYVENVLYGLSLMNISDASFHWGSTNQKKHGSSIRLARDSTPLAEGEKSTMIDIDGNVYPTKCIGGKEWMMSNLKVKHYNDGTVIPIVTNNAEWVALITGAMCFYDNIDPLNP